MIDRNELVQELKKHAEESLANNKILQNVRGNDKINVVNQFGQKFGIDKLSIDYPDVFEEIANYVTELQKNKMGNKDNNITLDIDEILQESVAMELPTSKHIMRYDDDIVVKTIKDILSKEFNNIKLLTIIGDEGGAFYTMEISLSLEENISNDLEMKRFYISQLMANFKSKFFGAISAILPVINITTGSYQFTKNSSKVKFDATICLSHTNDRDWVSGVYRGVDEKKQAEIDRRQKVIEASSSKQHVMKPMTLEDALRRYRKKEISMKVLETAIKACGRNELEIYVLRTAGINIKKLAGDTGQDHKTISDDATENIGTKL